MQEVEYTWSVAFHAVARESFQFEPYILVVKGQTTRHREMQQPYSRRSAIRQLENLPFFWYILSKPILFTNKQWQKKRYT